MAQLFEGHLRRVVGHIDRHLQGIEKVVRHNRGAAVARIYVDLAVGQVSDAFDLRARQQVEFLVVELGDVGDRRLRPCEKVLLLGVIEDVCRDDGKVDPAQKSEIDEVCERSVAEHRDHTPCRSVVDDVGEVLGDAR